MRVIAEAVTVRVRQTALANRPYAADKNALRLFPQPATDQKLGSMQI